MTTVTSSAPSTVPSIWLIPMRAPSVPRWLTGTRSGSAAVSVASMAPRPSSAVNQPTAITGTPRAAAAMLTAAAGRGGPVGQRARYRVGDQPGDRADAHHYREQDRVGPAGHLVRLQVV